MSEQTVSQDHEEREKPAVSGDNPELAGPKSEEPNSAGPTPADPNLEKSDRQKVLEEARAREKADKERRNQEEAAKHQAASERGKRAAATREARIKADLENQLQKLKGEKEAAVKALQDLEDKAKADAAEAQKAADKALQDLEDKAKADAAEAQKTADKALQDVKDQAAKDLEAAKEPKELRDLKSELKHAEDATKAAEKALQDANTKATAAEKAEQAANEERDRVQGKADTDLKELNEKLSTAKAAEQTANEERDRTKEKAETDLKELNEKLSTATAAEQAANEERDRTKEKAETDLKELNEKLSTTSTAVQTANEERDKVKRETERALKELNEKLAIAQRASGTMIGPDGSQRTLQEWQAEWEKNSAGRFVLPKGICGRRSIVQVEDPIGNPNAWRPDPKLLSKEDVDAQDAINAAINKWEFLPNAFIKPESAREGDSFKWVNADKLPRGNRLQLTMRSSIDLSEVVCPPGMAVVGVALGPWMGLDAAEGKMVEKATDPLQMSIKLYCTNPGEMGSKPQLFGNRGPKITINGDNTAGGKMSGAKMSEMERQFTPWPPSTLMNVYCDMRAVTYEKFAQTNDGDRPKSICSLAFYRFEPPNTQNRFSLLPSWQDSRWPRISPTPEAINRVFNDNSEMTPSLNWGRAFDQFGTGKDSQPAPFTCGIDRLYFDTNIIECLRDGVYWQVTGVQMYLKGKDTLALNVRFHPPQ